MIDTEDKVYSEVYGLIQLAGKSYLNMLPNKVKITIDEKRDKSYLPVYDIDVPLEKQNVQKDSLAILANIQYNYWCRTEQEKISFLKELKQIDIDKEKAMREKFNPDEIFKKSKYNNQNNEKEEVALAEVKKEKWYERVFSFFNSFFKK
ncbi:MAG TPA: hypothetical protein DCZ30_00420 [Clostridiales bacterium]|nr:hypothetical protein [Clostridiales bacterium]